MSWIFIHNIYLQALVNHIHSFDLQRYASRSLTRQCPTAPEKWKQQAHIQVWRFYSVSKENLWCFVHQSSWTADKSPNRSMVSSSKWWIRCRWIIGKGYNIWGTKYWSIVQTMWELLHQSRKVSVHFQNQDILTLHFIPDLKLSFIDRMCTGHWPMCTAIEYINI